MRNEKSMKIKLRILWFILLLLFLIFLITIFLPKNYSKKYTRNNVKITESYNKKEKRYEFTFNYASVVLDYQVESKYYQDRAFIKKVDVIKDKKENFCLIPKGKKITYIPLCYENKEKIHYTLVNNELKKALANYITKENQKISTYKDIDIYNEEFIYLLWNYDGFYYMNGNEKKKIDIFDKEMYNVNLIGYTKDYLVIADYDSNYAFNQIYTIDFKKGELKKVELDRDIYFDSYFLGYEKNELYIIDNKEEFMYKLNVKNGELTKIKSAIIKDGKWENVNIKTLQNKKHEFTYDTNYKYSLENKNLYLHYQNSKIKQLVATNVTDIIRIKDQDIFYLKEDALYHFNEIKGEEKLLEYFEWNFNYHNMIYIN